MSHNDPRGVLARRDRMPINGKDYGLVGDGSTDDYAALVAAIAAVPVGGLLYLPPGTYRMASKLTVTKSFTLFGDDYRACTIKFDNNLAAGGLLTLPATAFSLRGICFDASTPVNGNTLVQVGATVSFSAVDCRFTGCKTRAAINVNYWGSSGTGRGNILIQDSLFDTGDSGGGVGINTGDAAVVGEAITNIRIIGCQFIDIGSSALVIANQVGDVEDRAGTFSSVEVSNCVWQMNETGTYGPIPTELWGCDNLLITGNRCEAATRGLGFSYCRNVCFSNNTIRDQVYYACEIDGCDSVTIQGNSIKDCASFLFDTSVAAYGSNTNILVEGNSIEGCHPDANGTNICITSSGFSITKGWTIRGNKFKNFTMGRTVIMLNGIVGTGYNVIEGNEYYVDDETATFGFVGTRGIHDVVRNNVAIILANFTVNNPQSGNGTIVFNYDASDYPEGASDLLVEKNYVKFTGTISPGLYVTAYGASASPANTPRIRYRDNTAEGVFSYTIILPSTGVDCECRDNDFTRATGSASFGTGVTYQQRVSRYSGATPPASGSAFEVGDIFENTAPEKGGVAYWKCTDTSPLTWEPVMLADLVDKTLAYNVDMTLAMVTTAVGTKTMAYNGDGTLASVTGTGVYPTKTFTYDEDGNLTGVTVT